LFEVQAAGFVSHHGEVAGRLELEYELLLTQRLILQPRAETNIALRDVKELGIGSGVRDAELGLRLRYEIRREFAPYLGLVWTSKFGETAAFARSQRGCAESWCCRRCTLLVLTHPRRTGFAKIAKTDREVSHIWENSTGFLPLFWGLGVSNRWLGNCSTDRNSSCEGRDVREMSRRTQFTVGAVHEL